MPESLPLDAAAVAELRRRLERRFGSAVDAWFDELPSVLHELAAHWMLVLESIVPRGSMSAVIRCRATDGRRAVLKLSPDRTRLASEARALASWRTPHVPAVLAVDEPVGALLLEAVEPGTALVDADAYPSIERLGALISALHRSGRPATSYASVAARVAYLFDSATVHYERRPDLHGLISSETYERGRELALQLAEDAPSAVLLHGDLTPVNVLDGGNVRGLVAIDPAACIGDPAFDAVDLVLWRADDAGEIATRAGQLGAAIGVEGSRILAWCSAFAGMIALETAENGGAPQARLDAYVQLAARANPSF